MNPQESRPARASEDGALEALFQEHYHGLCSYVSSYTRSPAIAEEVVQDLFVALWRDRMRRPPSDLGKAYLYRAARNRALNQQRRIRLETSWRIEEGAGADPLSPTPEADIQSREVIAAVDAAIDALSPRTKEVFLLVQENELKYAEVAEVLEVSVKTVEYHMTKAFTELREKLAPLKE